MRVFTMAGQFTSEASKKAWETRRAKGATAGAAGKAAPRLVAKVAAPKPKPTVAPAPKPVIKPKAQRTAEYNDLMGTGRSGKTTSTTKQRAAYLDAQNRATRTWMKQHPPKTRADWEVQYAVGHEAGVQAALKAGWKPSAK